MKTVYLAAPLFSEAECDFNRKLRDELISLGFKVFLPQEDSNNVKDMLDRQKIIFNKNLKGIENSDIIVAVIDGADIDSGTAWEIGFAFAKAKPVLGLRTDFRTLGIEGTVNLMIERSVVICMSVSELLNHLKSRFR
ncbi:MAG: nucleoside 2-deoxyribosyltransferase [Candidatus Methanoperedens sp.]